MHRPVQIENEHLSMEVWPHLGGKVSSIIDKSDGFEILFNFPAEIPTEPNYGKPYDATWYAGWDECFPAVAAGAYVGHPYDGIGIPDHGEVYSIPVTTAVPTDRGITTVWHGLRFGYRMTRKLVLSGSTLTAHYTLANLAPFEFRFVWAQHALLSMESPVTLDVPGATAMRWSHSVGRDVNESFEWPRLDEADFTIPSKLSNGAWKLFTQTPISAGAIVKYPERARQLCIAFSSPNTTAFWGIWINRFEWNHQQHLAIEPTTGRYDQLDRSIADGSAARVAPQSSVEWRVDWTLS